MRFRGPEAPNDKQGSSLLRFLLVEAAQAAVRCNADWRRRYRHLVNASATEHCQGSDGTQDGSSLVLDVAEWP